MIKRTGYILLTTLLIISTVGVVISRHYCEQTLISVTVNAQADNCCDDMSGDCCHNENEYIVLKTDFIQPPVGQINIIVVDVFNTELISELNYPSTENTNNYLFSAILKPDKSRSLALIQSFLL